MIEIGSKSGIGPTMHINALSPREYWFYGIKEGNTPHNSQIVQITMKWIKEALDIIKVIRGQKAASPAGNPSVWWSYDGRQPWPGYDNSFDDK